MTHLPGKHNGAPCKTPGTAYCGIMKSRSHVPQALSYLAITAATILVLQGMVVVIHEFTHSTTAWLLGVMDDPRNIIWGNPVTMTGWDENVSYRKLFATGYDVEAAIAGIAPIIMHTAAVTAMLILMRTRWLYEKKWAFHTAYWYTVVNLMELIAYVYMRAFSGHGDLGNFDRGMDISPWWIFIFGSALLTWGLLLFYRDALPRLQKLFARDNSLQQWAILLLTSFVLFLWGSGIRVMAYVEGVQWTFGLIGIAGVGATIWLFRPKIDAQ